MLSYSLSIFAFIPFGGSCVTLIDLYNNEIGNFGCGLADKNNLKFGSLCCLNTTSIIDSSSGSNDIER